MNKEELNQISKVINESLGVIKALEELGNEIELRLKGDQTLKEEINRWLKEIKERDMIDRGLTLEQAGRMLSSGYDLLQRALKELPCG